MRKPAGPGEMPPPLELLCLRALWTLGEGCVDDVRQVLGETRPLAYTTIMTVLERLARRGAVSRHKAGRNYVYAPQLTRDELRRVAIRNLVDTFFEGSVAQLSEFLENGSHPAAAVPEARPPLNESQLDTVLL
jgi:predicted transcriptional regulator